MKLKLMILSKICLATKIFNAKMYNRGSKLAFRKSCNLLANFRIQMYSIKYVIPSHKHSLKVHSSLWVYWSLNQNWYHDLTLIDRAWKIETFQISIITRNWIFIISLFHFFFGKLQSKASLYQNWKFKTN